jgi:flagellar hook-basal body complex protein FliE
MSFAINPISTPALADFGKESLAAVSNSDPSASFGNVLSSAIQNVEAAHGSADAAAQAYMSGGTQELHSTILATQNAELDFQMFLQVRNKVVSAYEEIMKMQI